MSKAKNNNYAGLIGLGLLYMWGCALITWMDLWNSTNTFSNILSFFGMAAVSISGLAVVFYTSALEKEIKELKEKTSLDSGDQ